MAIQSIDPLEYVAEASELLTAAWKPPCIRYTPEYLSWQFSHPTGLTPISLLGEDAFVSATGRRFYFRGEQKDIHVSSYFCVRPGANPMTAVSVIRQHARLFKEAGCPCVLFAQPESVGESMLKAWDAKGFVRKSLGTYTVHAGVSKSEPAQVVEFGEWLSAFESLAPDGTSALLLDPHHYRNDPRGCRPAIAYADGIPTAAALIGATESITTTGIQVTPTLYCLHATSATGIKALISAAGGMALVPNVRLIDPAIVKAAGLRLTPSRFNGYLFCLSTSDPLLQVDVVEIEPV